MRNRWERVAILRNSGSAAVVGHYDGMRDGDGVLCFNFRTDHVRESFVALLDPGFSDFPRRRTVRICRGRVATKKAKAWARLDPAQTGTVYRR